MIMSDAPESYLEVIDKIEAWWHRGIEVFGILDADSYSQPDPEHLTVVRQGRDALATWRTSNPEARLELSMAELSGIDLSGADLTDANLAGADLSDSVLEGADLTSARLVGADLRHARLDGANLSNTQMFFANLSGADLSGARLQDAYAMGAFFIRARLIRASFRSGDLASTYFYEASFGFTTLNDVDLSSAEGLGTCNHEGASIIRIDTLNRSFEVKELLQDADFAEDMAKGGIEEDEGEYKEDPASVEHRAKRRVGLQSFFQRAGVDPSVVQYFAGVPTPVRYHSCLITYGGKDIEFAKWLRGSLHDEGVSRWLYTEDSVVGKRAWEDIGGARQKADRLIVICSVETLTQDGALQEIEDQANEDPEKLVPVSLDDIWKKPGFKVVRGTRDLKPYLLDRTYADFGNLPGEVAMGRLLAGLRVHAAKAH